MTNLGSGEDILDGLRDLGADTVTLDQTDEEVTLRIMLVLMSIAIEAIAKHCVCCD